jgi:uncharacterized protein (TIGR00251 family)
VSWLIPDEHGVVLNLRIVPRASRDEVGEEWGAALKIRLQAPPVEGKANRALIRFLADRLDVSPGHIELLSGETARTKRVRVEGMGAADVCRLLGQTVIPNEARDLQLGNKL